MSAKVSKGTAVVTTPSDTQILIMREFDAPNTWSTGRGPPLN